MAALQEEVAEGSLREERILEQRRTLTARKEEAQARLRELGTLSAADLDLITSE